VLTLGMLREMESLLRERFGGDPGFRLAHYFDLIAGTSTGAVIAGALALGMTVDEVHAHYMALGRKVFKRSLLRLGGPIGSLVAVTLFVDAVLFAAVGFFGLLLSGLPFGVCYLAQFLHTGTVAFGLSAQAPAQHGEEVAVGIGQHTGAEVSEALHRFIGDVTLDTLPQQVHQAGSRGALLGSLCRKLRAVGRKLRAIRDIKLVFHCITFS
jgi:hypothetical protein